MHRIDHVTKSTDENGTGKDGFTEGEASSQTPPTRVTGAIMNALQEELANVVEAQGGVLVKLENDQAQRAIYGQIDLAALGSLASCGTVSGALFTDAVVGFISAGPVDLPLLVLVRSTTSGQVQTVSNATIKFGGAISAETLGSASAEPLFGAAFSYSLQLFCVVGDSGEIQTSPDGSTWTRRTPDGSYSARFYSVTWDETLALFIAVGESGEIQTSPDGTTWTARTAGSGFVGTFYRVASYNGTIVAVGGDGAADGEIQTSVDGTTWVQRVGSGPDDFAACDATQWGFYASNLAVTYYSADGVTWADATSEIGFPAYIASPSGALVGAFFWQGAPYHGAAARQTALGYSAASQMLRRCKNLWVYTYSTEVFTSGMIGLPE